MVKTSGGELNLIVGGNRDVSFHSGSSVLTLSSLLQQLQSTQSSLSSNSMAIAQLEAGPVSTALAGLPQVACLFAEGTELFSSLHFH